MYDNVIFIQSINDDGDDDDDDDNDDDDDGDDDDDDDNEAVVFLCLRLVPGMFMRIAPTSLVVASAEFTAQRP